MCVHAGAWPTTTIPQRATTHTHRTHNLGRHHGTYDIRRPSPPSRPQRRGHVSLVAKNIAFDPSQIRYLRGTVTIHFDNKDTGVPHNLRCTRIRMQPQGSLSDFITGPNTITYTSRPLTPGIILPVHVHRRR